MRPQFSWNFKASVRWALPLVAAAVAITCWSSLLNPFVTG